MCLSSLCHPVMCLSHSHSPPSSFMSSLVCCHYFPCVNQWIALGWLRGACMGTMPVATPLGKMWSYHLKSTVHNEKCQEQAEARWEIWQDSKSLTTTGGFRDKRPGWKVSWHNSPPLTLICPGAIVKSYLNHCKDKLFLPIGRSTMWVFSSFLHSLTNLSLHCSDSCSKYLDLLHTKMFNCVQSILKPNIWLVDLV